MPVLAGTVAGLGRVVWVSEGNSAPLYSTSAVAIDDQAATVPGFGPQQGGPVIPHELGHVAGLRHAPDIDQLMYPNMIHDDWTARRTSKTAT